MSKSTKISGSTLSVIILLVFIWTLLPSGTSSGRDVFTFDHAANEGYVAFIVNEYEKNDTSDDEDDIQKCDGSGYITHGDGHKTPCPGCENCEKSQAIPIVTDEVKKNSIQNPVGNTTPEIVLVKDEVVLDTEATQERQPLMVQGRSKQILLFTAYWCDPCRLFKNNEIPKFNMNPNWIVDESEKAHIRIVDIDKKANKPLMEKYKKTRVVPEFVKIINDKFVGNKSGFYSAKQIAEWYNE